MVWSPVASANLEACAGTGKSDVGNAVKAAGGPDKLKAPEGCDWQAVAATDWLKVADGPDWLKAAKGPDWLKAEEGPDRLEAAEGPKWLKGADGTDWLKAAAGTDWLKAAAGTDWLKAVEGPDWLKLVEESVLLPCDALVERKEGSRWSMLASEVICENPEPGEEIT